VLAHRALGIRRAPRSIARSRSRCCSTPTTSTTAGSTNARKGRSSISASHSVSGRGPVVGDRRPRRRGRQTARRPGRDDPPAALRREWRGVRPLASITPSMHARTVAAAADLTAVTLEDEFLEGLQFILDGIDRARTPGIIGLITAV
jgi:hypothetical protein